MLKSKSHPKVFLYNGQQQNSKLKKPLERPLSDSSEGQEKGKTLNKRLKEKAKRGPYLLTLSFMFCLLLKKTSSLAFIGKTKEGQNVFHSAPCSYSFIIFIKLDTDIADRDVYISLRFRSIVKLPLPSPTFQKTELLSCIVLFL